jgi:hypothetical protein
VQREQMRLLIQQADEADMAAFRAAHPKHMAAELEYYAQLVTQRMAASGATTARADASSLAASASSSAVGPSTVAVESSMDMDSDWWDNLVHEIDAEEAAKKAAQ